MRLEIHSIALMVCCGKVLATGAPQAFLEIPELATIDPLGVPTDAMTSKDDLLGKHIQDLINISNIKRAIIVRNDTQAPGSIHLNQVLKLIKCNSLIESVPGISLTDGRYKINIGGEWPNRWDNIYFEVLLELKDNSIFCLSRTPLGFRILSRHGTGILKECD